MVLRPYYPVSGLFRVVRDDDGLQVDFMATVHGFKSFESVRSRATVIELDGTPIVVASLADIIRSKRAAGRPRARPCSRYWSERMPKDDRRKAARRRAALAALKAESERNLLEMIRRWKALPPHRRTHFLRKRVRFRVSAA
jgi:hypothetical protein